MVKGFFTRDITLVFSPFLNNTIIYIYILCTSLAVMGYIRQHPYPLLRALSTGVEYTNIFLTSPTACPARLIDVVFKRR